MNDYDKPYEEGQNIREVNMAEDDSVINNNDEPEDDHSVVALVTQESMLTNGDPCSLMLWGEELDGHVMDRSA